MHLNEISHCDLKKKNWNLAIHFFHYLIHFLLEINAFCRNPHMSRFYSLIPLFSFFLFLLFFFSLFLFAFFSSIFFRWIIQSMCTLSFRLWSIVYWQNEGFVENVWLEEIGWFNSTHRISELWNGWFFSEDQNIFLRGRIIVNNLTAWTAWLWYLPSY